MQNHIHGIIILTESMVGTRHVVSLREQFAKPVIGSVPTIVRSFKSAATKRIHEIRNTPSLPVWHGRYFDNIIRSDKELGNIREYIFNNILKWAYESQHENPDNLLSSPDFHLMLAERTSPSQLGRKQTKCENEYSQ